VRRRLEETDSWYNVATMHYEGIEYVVRAGPGLDQWTLLIYFPQKGCDENATVIKFAGSREAATGAARRRIDNWLKRQREKARRDERMAKENN
jgi:hypothetical protein